MVDDCFLAVIYLLGYLVTDGHKNVRILVRILVKIPEKGLLQQCIDTDSLFLGNLVDRLLFGVIHRFSQNLHRNLSGAIPPRSTMPMT